MTGSLIIVRQAPPDEVDLDQLMVKLKALAAAAQEVPPPRTSNKNLVTAAAVALSIASGAVTAQYLFPGHPRAVEGPSKGLANASLHSARDAILGSTQRALSR